MPMYDFKCDHSACGAVFEALKPVGTLVTECRVCGGMADKVWLTRASNVIGDECDIWQENGFATPQHFRSKLERRRALKEGGYEEGVRHVGVPGTDKSPHTQSWAAIGPGTLEAARSLLERVGGVRKSDEQEESELDEAVHVGDVQVPIEVSPGRTLGLRIGNVYHGVLDPAVLKGG